MSGACPGLTDLRRKPGICMACVVQPPVTGCCSASSPDNLNFVRGPPRPVRGRSRKSRKRWLSWRTWALTGMARSVSKEVNSDGAHSAQRPSSLRASAAAPVGLPQSGHRAE